MGKYKTSSGAERGAPGSVSSPYIHAILTVFGFVFYYENGAIGFYAMSMKI
jgi:hypothetical protein